MIFDIVVLFLVLLGLWLERLYGWYEDARDFVTRCFVQGVSRAWDWVVIHDLCPCTLILRLTSDTASSAFERASGVCIWVDRRADDLEARYGC